VAPFLWAAAQRERFGVLSMAKKQILPPDIKSLTKAIDIFTKQGDRGTALIVAAWVDDALEAVIRSRFRPDKPLADDLLRPDGPLGSFSARIKLGYMLDLLEHLARKDLDLIRKIRNDFAHARSDLRFTTPSIRDRCRELHGAKACQEGGLMLRSPKQKFIATAYFLVKYVMSFAQPKRRNPLLEETDAYGAWIRRTVKHASLELLARELKAL
jgi:DNA-binding MltR family transcriptional regulator